MAFHELGEVCARHLAGFLGRLHAVLLALALEDLQQLVGREVALGADEDAKRRDVAAGDVRGILANANIFGLDLTTTPLAAKIEGYYARLMAGPGSARRLLQEELPEA